MEDKLRQQLLGQKASKDRQENNRYSSSRLNRPLSAKHKLHDTKGKSESGDELGRTAFEGKNTIAIRKRPDSMEIQVAPAQPASEVDCSNVGPQTSYARAAKKRSSSYLDEVLFARSMKRKSKKKAKHNQT